MRLGFHVVHNLMAIYFRSIQCGGGGGRGGGALGCIRLQTNAIQSLSNSRLDALMA